MTTRVLFTDRFGTGRRFRYDSDEPPCFCGGTILYNFFLERVSDAIGQWDDQPINPAGCRYEELFSAVVSSIYASSFYMADCEGNTADEHIFSHLEPEGKLVFRKYTGQWCVCEWKLSPYFVNRNSSNRVRYLTGFVVGTNPPPGHEGEGLHTGYDCDPEPGTDAWDARHEEDEEF